MVAGCRYVGIGDAGVEIILGGAPQTIEADTIVVCAGQDYNRELVNDLTAANLPFDVIGGADVAAELDALRAIDQGMRIGYRL